MRCPKCGVESNGAFCPQCGTPLRGARCSGCEKPLAPGARFCPHCGTPAAGAARSGPSHLGWWVLGAALALLIVFLVVQAVRRDASPAAAGGPAFQQPGGGPPMLSGSMRENGDRLFNRVMQAVSTGDSADARRFAPMAVQAYQAAGDLDDDARYHIILLQTIAGDPAGALATAEDVLSRNPRHLLALAAAGEAAAAAGDRSASRAYYRRFLESFEAEQSAALPEYQDHARILPEYREAAQRALAGS